MISNRLEAIKCAINIDLFEVTSLAVLSHFKINRFA